MRHPYPRVDDLVLSYSAINTFKRCRKLYDITYEQLIDTGASDAADFGSCFHEMVALAALPDGQELFKDPTKPRPETWEPDMEELAADVFNEYTRRFPIPQDVLLVEQPIYTKLIRGVWLKTTVDLVYNNGNGFITWRDYKTFSKAPTLDVDLDFQGGIYDAAMARWFKTEDIQGEYEYVRSVPPGTKNSKGVWLPEECYQRVLIVRSKKEREELWAETQDVARDILRARRLGMFYRSGNRKEFGSPCFSCWATELCKAELHFGRLSEEDVKLLAVGYKERDVLPAQYR